MNLTLAVVTGAIAAISGDALINALVWLVILALVFWVVQWALSQMPIQEPFNKIIRVLLILIVALIAINVLLGLAGHPIVRF